MNPELPVPPHFDPARTGSIWRVPYRERADQATTWARRHAIGPAAADRPRTGLLLIDLQCTFCLPDFELPVAGAVGDARRLCDFIYRNLPHITQIVVSLDTHSPAQIFHPLFWVDPAGRHPGPMTPIPVTDIEAGRWRVNPDLRDHLALAGVTDLDRYALHYARTLEATGKYTLMIWPYHALLGGIGHALVPAVEEAVFFHGVARQTVPLVVAKGNRALTEHYSAVGPEVVRGAGGEEVGRVDRDLLDTLLGFDRLYVAGQAKSHCVAWTVADLLAEAERRGPDRASRIHLLEDCCSPVVVPGVVDFTTAADEAFLRFAARGVRRVRSVDPVAETGR